MMQENNQILIYQSEDGQTQVDVRMENDTVWLTQAQMAELLFHAESAEIAEAHALSLVCAIRMKTLGRADKRERSNALHSATSALSA